MTSGYVEELKRNLEPLVRHQQERRSAPAHATSRAAMVGRWLATFDSVLCPRCAPAGRFGLASVLPASTIVQHSDDARQPLGFFVVSADPVGEPLAVWVSDNMESLGRQPDQLAARFGQKRV